MRHKMMTLIAGLSLAGLLSSCATAAPEQLVAARTLYSNSANGLAGKLAPTELYDARKVLDKANQEFEENGDTVEVRDYAYIAHRKIELANVKARTEADRKRIAAAEGQGIKVRDLQVKEGQEALEASRDYSAALQATNTAQGKELDQASADLEAERQARAVGDERLAGAMTDLRTIAAVKEEQRGVVITLSGSVLFASGKARLLETAKTRLDQVATALQRQGSSRRMTVEGHTDSQGSDAVNLPLSRSRANAVRDYLVTRGIASDRIDAIGLGSSRPLVANDSPANRANNRRVEIVVHAGPYSAR